MLFDDDSRLLEDHPWEIKSGVTKGLFLTPEALCEDSILVECVGASLGRRLNLFTEEEEEKAAKSHIRKIGDKSKDVSKGIDDAEGSVKKAIQAFYHRSDEDLVENPTHIFKTFAKWAILIGVAHFTIVGAAVAWYIDRKLRKFNNKKQREELLFKLKTEIKVLDTQINDETDRDKRAALMRLKATYERQTQKLRANGTT